MNNKVIAGIIAIIVCITMVVTSLLFVVNIF